MKAFVNKKKPKLSSLAALCVITVLALLLSNGVVTLAKYVLERNRSSTYVAAPFYFSSDVLKESSPACTVEEPAAGGQVVISFHLYNFVDDLRWAQEEITYKCTAAAADGTVISRAEAEKTGKIPAGKNGSAAVELKLNAEDFAQGPVTVTAEASPYKKQLSARFSFAGQPDGLQWDVTEQEGAVVLELAGGDGTALNITWPAGLVPDPAASLLENITAGGGTFTPAAGGRYALVFLPTDPETAYSKTDFSVSASGS